MAQPLLNLNQFTQAPVVGMEALGIGSANNVIQAVVSANQATTLSPGQAIKFDTATLQAGSPAIVSCAPNAYADGYVLYDVKNGGLVLTAGVECQILLSGFIWMYVDGTTIDQGLTVEDTSNVGGVEPLGTSGGSLRRGTAIDYGVSGSLIRVNLLPAIIKAVLAAS
jgi:hypothetical protein